MVRKSASGDRRKDRDLINYSKIDKFYKNFVVLDFETTGLSPYSSKIIQIGALKYRGLKMCGEYCTNVDPGCRIPKFITALTGISDGDVRGAPSIENALPPLVDFIGKYPVVAHNASFDIKFLMHNMSSCGIGPFTNTAVDTLRLSRIYIRDKTGGKLENYKLTTLKDMLNIKRRSHDSIDDCYVCAEVYLLCRNICESLKKQKLDAALSCKTKND